MLIELKTVRSKDIGEIYAVVIELRAQGVC